MGFKTLLNLSGNRFFKQDINSKTNFNGVNEFSVPLEDRRLGPNLEDVSKTVIQEGIITPFEYDKETDLLTITFQSPEMSSSKNNIPDFINFYSEETINVDPIFVGFNPYFIKNVEFYNNYIGYEYDLIIDSVDETYTHIFGSFYTDSVYEVVAGSLDYKGDNDVVKINGNAIADEFIMYAKYRVISPIDGEAPLTSNTIININDESSLNLKTNLLVGWNCYINTGINSCDLIYDGVIINTLPSNHFFEVIKLSNSEFKIIQHD